MSFSSLTPWLSVTAAAVATTTRHDTFSERISVIGRFFRVCHLLFGWFFSFLRISKCIIHILNVLLRGKFNEAHMPKVCGFSPHTPLT